jgi:hypothetical protein
MKLKVLLGMLFVAGVAAALAVATPTRADSGTTGTTTTTSSTTTTSGKHHGKKDEEHGSKKGSTTTSTSTSTTTTGKKDKPKCQKVELKGSNGSGTLALTVDKANHGGQSLVGKQVTLTIPAGASVKANACIDASGVLTLRELHVEAKHVSSSTTTSATTTTTHS